MSDCGLGIYEKYIVERTDGSSKRCRKHDGCDYFVLDMTHDKHAATALLAYAKSCASEKPELSAQLMERFQCPAGDLLAKVTK